MDYFSTQTIFIFGIIIGIGLTLALEFAVKEMSRR